MQEETNLTFSGGRDLVAKRLQYVQMDSPQFFEDHSAQKVKPVSLSRYQNILEKIQIDNNLTNEDHQRSSVLEPDSEHDQSARLNQAYKHYIERKDYDVHDEDYKNYLKGEAANDNLGLEDIISHPETLHFLQNEFKGDIKIDIKLFVDRVIKTCELNFSSKADQKAFTRLMKARLTTSNPRVVSLNALEISTKEAGIYTFVEDLVKLTLLEGQQSKQNEINSQIVSELMTVKEMLEAKKSSLKREEQRLIELEQQLTKQRSCMSEQLQTSYDALLKQLDSDTTLKMQVLNKRFHVIEQQLKTKLKLIESKGVNVTKRNQSSQSDAEKFKAKIFFLEKQLDSYKMKAVDGEKKLMTERECTKNVQLRCDKLATKNTNLEKMVKELQHKLKGEDSSVSESQIEQPIEVVEQPKVVTKVASKTTTSNEEGDALKSSLLVLDGLVNSIRTLQRILGIEKNDYNNLIGEVVYPHLSTILSPLIDLIPVVFTKHSESCLVVSQLLFSSILFAFNKKHKRNVASLLPADELERIKQKNKSNQQHVNEVMQQGQTRDFEYYVSLPCSFWRKKLKLKVVEEKTRQSKLFQLTQSDEIQRELINIFRTYIQTSEQHIKRTLSNDMQKFEISNSKFNSYAENKVLTSRSNACYMILMLAYTSKDSVFAMKNITYDLRNDNEHLSQHLKQYLSDTEISYILVMRLQEDLKDLSLIIPAIELILELCSKGIHYDQFLKQLSTHINTFLQILMINLKDNDLCEKLSIIIQRVMYACGSQVTGIDLAKLESKMQEVRGGQSPLLESNLKSIIEMIIHE